MGNSKEDVKDFPFQLDEFYLDLQEDGSRISLLEEKEMIERPFPGLRPFRTSEFQLFKGRDGQAEELIKRLKKNHFLSVIGSSGTGKSSLVRAGLIPQLFGGYLHEAGNKWNIAICRPGKDPVGNLSIALSSVKSHSKEKNIIANYYETVKKLLRDSVYGVLEVNELLKSDSKPENKNLLIIVDQFEELFRFERKDLGITNIESHFVNLLLKASANPNNPIYVIITMRSEFLGDCVKYRGLPEAINEGQYLVPQLSRNQLKEVIEGPINLAKKIISPGLVELLINEIEESKLKENLDQLPILQHALMRTYNAALKEPQTKEINYEHYKSIGGMEKALANHAEAKYKELGEGNNDDNPSKKQKIAKIVFQALTDLSSDQKGGRKPTELKNIYAIADIVKASEIEVNEVINHFRGNDTSFIMPPFSTSLYPGLIMDISHESLMRNWDQLNEWIKEEVYNGKLYKMLNERREFHEKDNKEWIKGELLREILEWKKIYGNKRAWAYRYLQTGKSEITFELIEDNYQKNLEFLEASRMESESEKESEKRKLENDIKRDQREKRVKIIVWTLFVAAVITGLLALWGFKERRMALIQKQIADSSAIEYKIQKQIADSNTHIALIQKQRADSAAQAAQMQKKRADSLAITAINVAKEADLLRKNAEEKADSIQLQKIAIEVEKRIAERKSFEYELTERPWWNNDLLNKRTRDSLKSSLFNWYYPPNNIKPNYADSLSGKKLVQSLELLNEANNKKFEDWFMFMYLLKDAKNFDNNYATNSVLDSILKTTILYNQKFTVPGSGGQNKSLVLKFSPKSIDEFIVVSPSGFYRYNRKDSISRDLLTFKPGTTSVTLSKDVSKLLAYNQYDKEFIIYEYKNGAYKKNDVLQKLNKINNIKTKKSNKDNTNTYTTNNNLKAVFSPSNSCIATYDGKDWTIYDLNSEKVRSFPSQNIMDLSFSPDGKKLLLCFNDSAIIYDMVNNRSKSLKIEEKPAPQSNPVSNNGLDNIVKGHFSTDGSLIWIITNFQKHEWKADGSFNQSFNIDKSFDNIFVLPDNNRYLICNERYSNNLDKGITILDKDFNYYKIFPWHSSKVKDADISDDNKWIISGDEQVIYLWNINEPPLSENNIESYINKDKLKSYYFASAVQDINSGNLKEAVIPLNKAAKIDSKDNKILNLLGKVNFSLEKYDTAIMYYKMSLNIDTGDVVIWTNLGNTHYCLKEYNQAYIVLKKALTIDSTYARAWNILGNCCNATQKNDMAVEFYTKALKFNSMNYVYWNNLGASYYYINQLAKAIECIRKSIEINKEYYISWLNLAYFTNRMEKYTEAISYADKATALMPKNANSYAHKGYAWLKLGNLDSAFKNINRARDLDINYDKSYFYLSCYYALKNKKLEAINSLKTSIDKGFDDIEWIETEACFINIRKDQEFIDLLRRLKEELNNKK